MIRIAALLIFIFSLRAIASPKCDPDEMQDTMTALTHELDCSFSPWDIKCNPYKGNMALAVAGAATVRTTKTLSELVREKIKSFGPLKKQTLKASELPEGILTSQKEIYEQKIEEEATKVAERLMKISPQEREDLFKVLDTLTETEKGLLVENLETELLESRKKMSDMAAKGLNDIEAWTNESKKAAVLEEKIGQTYALRMAKLAEVQNQLIDKALTNMGETAPMAGNLAKSTTAAKEVAEELASHRAELAKTLKAIDAKALAFEIGSWGLRAVNAAAWAYTAYELSVPVYNLVLPPAGSCTEDEPSMLYMTVEQGAIGCEPKFKLSSRVVDFMKLPWEQKKAIFKNVPGVCDYYRDFYSSVVARNFAQEKNKPKDIKIDSCNTKQNRNLEISFKLPNDKIYGPDEKQIFVFNEKGQIERFFGGPAKDATAYSVEVRNGKELSRVGSRKIGDSMRYEPVDDKNHVPSYELGDALNETTFLNGAARYYAAHDYFMQVSYCCLHAEMDQCKPYFDKKKSGDDSSTRESVQQ